MTNNVLRRWAGFSALVLLVALAAQIVPPLILNRWLEVTFEEYYKIAGNNSSYNWRHKFYLAQTPMEEMDMAHLSSRLGGLYIGENLTFELPADIRYYRYINARHPSLVQTKGATLVREYGSNLFFGYSYPTYDKGWRYMKPLPTADGVNFESYYYVRIEDIERAIWKYYEAESGCFYYRDFYIDREIMYSRGSIRRLARFTDNTMYHLGIYLSPDMYYDVFGLTEALLLGAAALFGAAYVALRLRGRKLQQNI